MIAWLIVGFLVAHAAGVTGVAAYVAASGIAAWVAAERYHAHEARHARPAPAPARPAPVQSDRFPRLREVPL